MGVDNHSGSSQSSILVVDKLDKKAFNNAFDTLRDAMDKHREAIEKAYKKAKEFYDNMAIDITDT